mmetsp:Transcript_10939/g.17605  ORF Transcript_10939/g.17605 Transcript_10939/m.17605 type:complete len:109 (+) Transcript_10939:585-911(+)
MMNEGGPASTTTPLYVAKIKKRKKIWAAGGDVVTSTKKMRMLNENGGEILSKTRPPLVPNYGGISTRFKHGYAQETTSKVHTHGMSCPNSCGLPSKFWQLGLVSASSV